MLSTQIACEKCRNTEVQHAVDELVRLVETFPRENMDVCLDPEDIAMFKQYHSKLMYKVQPSPISPTVILVHCPVPDQPETSLSPGFLC